MTIQTINETTLEHFCEFLRVHLSSSELDVGGGTKLNFPDFDLIPMDYLEYAEEALSTPCLHKFLQAMDIKQKQKKYRQNDIKCVFNIINNHIVIKIF